jgi:hypothetical protein
MDLDDEVLEFRGNFFNTSLDHQLWIQELENNGNFTNRFVLRSDVGLKFHFDIDINERRIFVITEESEIRAYPF